MLKFRMTLSEEAMGALSDIISDPSLKDTPSEGKWILQNAILPILKRDAVGVNLLKGRGSIDMSDGTILNLSDMKPFPLETFENGNIEILIGDRTKERIENHVSFTEAVNRLKNTAGVAWHTAREWILELTLVTIAQESANLDDRMIEDEQKENYK